MRTRGSDELGAVMRTVRREWHGPPVDPSLVYEEGHGGLCDQRDEPYQVGMSAQWGGRVPVGQAD